jgi:hypothetical protein
MPSGLLAQCEPRLIKISCALKAQTPGKGVTVRSDGTLVTLGWGGRPGPRRCERAEDWRPLRWKVGTGR